MSKIVNTAKSTKNFVVKHRVGIAVVATSAFWIYVNKNNMEQYNAFLKDNGLYDQFYAMPEDL